MAGKLCLALYKIKFQNIKIIDQLFKDDYVPLVYPGVDREEVQVYMRLCLRKKVCFFPFFHAWSKKKR